MPTSRTNISRCLREPSSLFQSTRDMLPSLWKKRLNLVTTNVLEFGWVVVIYLMSELIIWGLSRALAPVKLEFFSSIFGMVLAFCCMALAYLCFSGVDDMYRRYVKSKVDFINVHLGLGFPIPLVMFNEGDILGGRDIACIIGNFGAYSYQKSSKHVLTPCSGDESCFLGHGLCAGTSRHDRRSKMDNPRFRRLLFLPISDGNPPTDRNQLALGFIPRTHNSAPGRSSREDSEQNSTRRHCSRTRHCALLRLQREVKTSSLCPDMPKLKNAIVTLMNPVLFTTLLMTAYTRAKAGAYGFENLPEVLMDFSSGTPLYVLWTSMATGTPLSDDRTPWFGAGDTALSILECGILIWGFKLYECQRQLFSLAGFLTVLIATAAATGNVFVSVMAGSFIGLDPPEALAFAARSTTLALAKPAMAALGGNLGVNAALVVSNGILGQLCYPFVLDKLGVKREDNSTRPLPESESRASRLSFRPLLKTAQQDLASGDDPFTISAGITVGINGAAMGVSYLYETKSRAAPYAALAMTVSGVMTVVFTTVEPFKGVVLCLAG